MFVLAVNKDGKIPEKGIFPLSILGYHNHCVRAPGLIQVISHFLFLMFYLHVNEVLLVCIGVTERFS